MFVVNDAEFFCSHRLPIAVAARARGYDVHVATPAGPGVEAIVAAGLRHHSLPLSRRVRVLRILALPHRRGPPAEARGVYQGIDEVGPAT